MKTKKPELYFIYSRKSKFTGRGESVENQITICKEYIKLHFEVSEDQIRVFEDEGFSGGNTDRPQFTQMMSLCKSNDYTIKAVVCYRLDRLSRKVADFSTIFEELKSRNIYFISVKDRFDTTTPIGKAMMYIATVFAQLERDVLTERIVDNKLELAKTGRWLGGTTPTGYKSTEVITQIDKLGRKRKSCHLESIPEEEQIIKKIFSVFLETNSLTKTEENLKLAGISTKNGADYSRNTIKPILQNPVYACADMDTWEYLKLKEIDVPVPESAFDGKHGLIAYNKTEQTTGKAHKMRDMSEWIISVGRHRPFIAGKDWIRTQELLAQNSSKSYRKPKSNMALLSGLVFCKNCGDYMRPKTLRQTDEHGNHKFSYLCVTKEKSHMQRCSSKNVPGNQLDEMVCNAVKQLAEDDSVFMNELGKALSAQSHTENSLKTDLQLLKEKHEALDDKIHKLSVSLADLIDTPSFGYVTEQINHLDKEKKELEEKISYQQELLKHQLTPTDSMEIIRILLHSFADTFDTMTFEEKRNALRVLIDRIEWDGENADIYFIGTSDTSPKGATAEGLPMSF